MVPQKDYCLLKVFATAPLKFGGGNVDDAANGLHSVNLCCVLHITDHRSQANFCDGDFERENLKAVVISYSTEACFAIHERYFQL